MSRTHKDSRKGGGHKQRHISVRAVRRDPPDLRRLSRALIELAVAQAQAEAEAQKQAMDIDHQEHARDDRNSGSGDE